MYAVSTTDNSTFTEATVFTGGDTQQGQPAMIPGVFISSRTALKGRVGSETYVRGTADLTTWSNAFTSGQGTKSRATSLHFPWDPARNADESIAFYGGGNNNSTDGYLYRWMSGTGAAISTSLKFTDQPRNGISSFAGNANRLLWCASN